MTNTMRKTLRVALAVVAAVVALDSLYLLGYHRGSQDALDWEFSAVIGGKVVPVGHGSTLLRSRLDLRPACNVNMVSGTFSSPIRQP